VVAQTVQAVVEVQVRQPVLQATQYFKGEEPTLVFYDS
jgi:hypothetical protein